MANQDFSCFANEMLHVSLDKISLNQRFVVNGLFQRLNKATNKSNFNRKVQFESYVLERFLSSVGDLPIERRIEALEQFVDCTEHAKEISACVLDEHVWVFGDDHFDRLTGEQHGPHSSAIIIGASVVLTTAHSLCFEPDTSKRSKTKVCYYKHAEVYWVQKTITKDASGAFTTEDRVPVRLFKFSTVNDWAVLVRTDGKTFAGGARVHEEPTPFTSTRFLRANATLLHCPVSLIANLRAAGEYSLHVNANAVSLQQCSTHHVQYDDVSYRGSSGGALHVEGVDGVFGMHTTLWTECEYGDEDGVDIDSVDEYGVRHVFARSTPKLSGSESNSYPELPPPKKAKKDCDSESVVSRLAGGNNGQGRALVISQFPRLMFYLKAAAEEAAAEVAAAEVDVDADAAV